MKLSSSFLVGVVIAVASAGCGGENFESRLFAEEADSAIEADAAKAETSVETSTDAGLEAETGMPDSQEPDAAEAGDDAAAAEAGDDAAPEAGPEACVAGTCDSLGKNCGPTPDGCGGTLACGTCPATQLCGGGGVPNVCGGCVPDTCESHGFKCGTMDDGCGNTIVCGPAPTNTGANANCEAMGLSELWQCGGAAAAEPEFAPPFPSCQPYYYYYCCP